VVRRGLQIEVQMCNANAFLDGGLVEAACGSGAPKCCRADMAGGATKRLLHG